MCVCGTYRPELDEILDHRGPDDQTVERGVGQEQDEELVVGEPHTVVHPDRERGRTMRPEHNQATEVRGQRSAGL